MKNEISNSGVSIKVSVLMITYNHENFIAPALKSVLMQEVNEEYEIVIGEDCSTDNTLSIIRNIQEENPEKIRLVTSETNIGANRNLVRTYQACRGEYIAILEGDDIWTDSHKLSKQINFLDTHPEFSICFHDALVIDDILSEEVKNYCDPDQKEISTIEDLLEKNFIPTCSVMFRNNLIDNFPDWFYSLYMGDWPLHIFNSQHGKIGYLNEPMAKYRVHSAGMLSRLGYSNRLKGIIKFYSLINRYLNNHYENIIQHEVLDRWEKLAVELIECGYQLGIDNVSIVYVSDIFKNWPAEIPYSKKWRVNILGQIYERLFFAHYLDHKFANVRYCFMVLLLYKPQCLWNRGVWSIGVKTFLGNRVIDWLKLRVKRSS